MKVSENLTTNLEVFLLDLEEVLSQLKELKQKVDDGQVDERTALLTFRRRLESLGFAMRRNRQVLRWLVEKGKVAQREHSRLSEK